MDAVRVHKTQTRFLRSYKLAEDIINTKFKNVFPDWTVDYHSLGGKVYNNEQPRKVCCCRSSCAHGAYK